MEYQVIHVENHFLDNIFLLLLMESRSSLCNKQNTDVINIVFYYIHIHLFNFIYFDSIFFFFKLLIRIIYKKKIFFENKIITKYIKYIKYKKTMK